MSWNPVDCVTHIPIRYGEDVYMMIVETEKMEMKCAEGYPLVFVGEGKYDEWDELQDMSVFSDTVKKKCLHMKGFETFFLKKGTLGHVMEWAKRKHIYDKDPDILMFASIYRSYQFGKGVEVAREEDFDFMLNMDKLLEDKEFSEYLHCYYDVFCKTVRYCQWHHFNFGSVCDMRLPDGEFNLEEYVDYLVNEIAKYKKEQEEE